LAITDCWKDVKNFFQTFQEWYNDLELYHYIGYLIEKGISISKIITEWDKPNESVTKEIFMTNFIIPTISKTLTDCSDLNKEYEISGNPKTQCFSILLLHNIQTVINQNKTMKDSEKYKLPVFYKFPFHLFKKEKWDVEHIDSYTENSLETPKEQKEWLKYSYEHIDDNAKLENGKNLKEEIRKFINNEVSVVCFRDLRDEIIKSGSSNSEKLKDYSSDSGENVNEKNKLWNFTLLDFSTNRSYGNDIFPAKRRVIIGKDQGKKYEVDDNLEITEFDGIIAFVPPCTKQVFLKYFNPSTNNLREWDKKDAEAYLNNIKTTLSIFIDRKEQADEQ
jgi:hypothetical protein